MEEILPNIEKVIIEGKAGDRVLPYLPLERLKTKSGTVAEEQKP
jgi:membrane protease subunit HflK